MNKLMYSQLITVGQVTGDPREFNQQRQVYYPRDTTILIELEITKENFYLSKEFYEQKLQWELGTGEKPKIPETLLFTPLGWSRVMEQLEAPYKSSYAAVAETGEDLWEDEEQY